MEVKSCQKWVMDKTGGIDPQAKSTVCLSCTAQQQLLFSCCARLAAPRSLCVCVHANVCVCVFQREKKRESCPRCRFLFIKYSHSHLYASAASSLSVSLSFLSALLSSFVPSLPQSRSLALSLPRSLSPVYLQSPSSLSVDHHPALSLLLYIYLARTADNSPCNIFSSFVCELSCRPLIPAPC